MSYMASVQSTATHLLGWVSSALLVTTIGSQVFKQWKADSSDGVSRYLYYGQIAASAGFTAYSVAVGDAVFVTTNLLLMALAVAGLLLLLRHRRRDRPARARSGSRLRPGGAAVVVGHPPGGTPA